MPSEFKNEALLDFNQPDNEKAMQELNKSLDENYAAFGNHKSMNAYAENSRQEQIKLLINEHVWLQKIGFIMMKPEPYGKISKYDSRGIDLNVLNEKRFNMAFPLVYWKEDENKINSIMRPTLPDASFWGGIETLR